MPSIQDFWTSGFQLGSKSGYFSKILEKYPDFDPNWKPEVQKSWMEGMIKLYDGIN